MNVFSLKSHGRKKRRTKKRKTFGRFFFCTIYFFTFISGLLLDLLERIKPLAHGVDVQVFQAEIVPLNQVQVVEHVVQKILTKTGTLEGAWKKKKERELSGMTGIGKEAMEKSSGVNLNQISFELKEETTGEQIMYLLYTLATSQNTFFGFNTQ